MTETCINIRSILLYVVSIGCADTQLYSFRCASHEQRLFFIATRAFVPLIGLCVVMKLRAGATCDLTRLLIIQSTHDSLHTACQSDVSGTPSTLHPAPSPVKGLAVLVLQSVGGSSKLLHLYCA